MAKLLKMESHTERLMLFFNRSSNPDLILAIQSVGGSRGRNGFRRDKSGEKFAESEEDFLEHRTDGSDAFDTLYVGCEKFPVHDIVSVPVSSKFFNRLLLTALQKLRFLTPKQ